MLLSRWDCGVIGIDIDMAAVVDMLLHLIVVNDPVEPVLRLESNASASHDQLTSPPWPLLPA